MGFLSLLALLSQTWAPQEGDDLYDPEAEVRTPLRRALWLLAAGSRRCHWKRGTFIDQKPV